MQITLRPCQNSWPKRHRGNLSFSEFHMCRTGHTQRREGHTYGGEGDRTHLWRGKETGRVVCRVCGSGANKHCTIH